MIQGREGETESSGPLSKDHVNESREFIRQADVWRRGGISMKKVC